MNNSRDIHSFEAMNPPEFGVPPDFSWSTAVKLTFVILIYCGCHHLGFSSDHFLEKREDILIRSEDTLG